MAAPVVAAAAAAAKRCCLSVSSSSCAAALIRPLSLLLVKQLFAEFQMQLNRESTIAGVLLFGKQGSHVFVGGVAVWGFFY